MSNGDVNESRRRLLVGATSVVGGVGVVGVAVPFVASWNPSAKAKAAGAPVRVSIGKVEPGQQITVEWRGQPVWIIRRTPEMLQNLDKMNDILADPNSEKKQQPEYVQGIYRALNPEYMIILGICTHLGCSPNFRPEIAAADLGDDWLGGFFCPCHGSKFDLSGRVYKGVPAPTNLVVPPHYYLDDKTVLIGLDKESA
jgi:ubiquinol-cytochrome c reductase iron-sulfur subunit